MDKWRKLPPRRYVQTTDQAISYSEDVKRVGSMSRGSFTHVRKEDAITFAGRMLIFHLVSAERELFYASLKLTRLVVNGSFFVQGVG
jgi:hypothetical protein